MTAIKSTKAVENDQQPRDSGVEGEIREFVRRDGQALRRAPENDSELVAHNIGTLLQRVAGTSVQEVDRLIGELQQLRELLHQEGARVQREITEYAHLSQSAMQSTKIIAESLSHWKGDSAARARG
ncbi:MAG TPA: hypothetical protein VFB68_18045 [Xanthobacteraceae bacterium]|nr:hypothetical protein [Xanthobacteraceae bacterium]